MPTSDNTAQDSAQLAENKGKELVALIDAMNGRDIPIDDATSMFAQCMRFRRWSLDPRPVFAPSGTNDKFSEMIILAREFSDCENLLFETWRLNFTTVWRWETKKTRPSRYAALSLVPSLYSLLLKCVEKNIHDIQAAKDAQRLDASGSGQ